MFSVVSRFSHKSNQKQILGFSSFALSTSLLCFVHITYNIFFSNFKSYTTIVVRFSVQAMFFYVLGGDFGAHILS